MKAIRIMILAAVLGYVFAAAFLWIVQRDFLYFPSTKLLHQFKETTFVFDDVQLNAIVLNEGRRRAIVYFGGNGESVVYNAPAFSELFADYTIYLVDYRGYGGSTGSPTEELLYADARRIYDSVAPNYHDISVIGRSLGSGVATYLAANREVARLVLITPFDSIENIAKAQYPIFPVSLLLKDKYDSAGRVDDIDASTMIIVAENDRVIPKRFSDALISLFPQSSVVVETIKSAGHNDLSNFDRYYTLLDSFLSVQ